MKMDVWNALNNKKYIGLLIDKEDKKPVSINKLMI